MNVITRTFNGFDGVKIVGDLRGSGPLVIFVHGFPELRQSWDRLADAVAASGRTACTIDVRGYGSSDRPAAIIDYRMEAIVGDLVAITREMHPSEPAVLVGHDMGAYIAWNAAMARPDVFCAIAALSIPWPGKAERPFNEIFTRRFTDRGRFFYQAYFQEPGRAEAELEADPAKFLLAFYHGLSGETEFGNWPTGKSSRATLLEGVQYSPVVPRWLAPEYFELAVSSFRRTGFAGALNRYRNHVIDFGWAADFDHIIQQPALFIGGKRDAGLHLMSEEPISLMQANVLRLSWSLLEGCGHWLQAERAEAVQHLVLNWLAEIGS